MKVAKKNNQQEINQDLKKQKGITLIALVTTVIVLLILVRNKFICSN